MAVEVLGVLISAVSISVGWFLGKRKEKIARQKYNLNARLFVEGWYGDFREWASESIEVMSEAVYYLSCNESKIDDYSRSVLKCRQRLSSLIDRGRFFLPNSSHNDHGTQKPPAYRGYRHPALDYLVDAERLLSEESDSESESVNASKMVELKREFVSIVQIMLEPRSRISEIDEMIKATREDDYSSWSFIDTTGHNK